MNNLRPVQLCPSEVHLLTAPPVSNDRDCVSTAVTSPTLSVPAIFMMEPFPTPNKLSGTLAKKFQSGACLDGYSSYYQEIAGLYTGGPVDLGITALCLGEEGYPRVDE